VRGSYCPSGARSCGMPAAQRPGLGGLAQKALIIAGVAVALLAAGAVTVALRTAPVRAPASPPARPVPSAHAVPGTSVNWTYATEDFVQSRPVVAGGTVYIGSGDDKAGSTGVRKELGELDVTSRQR
jgi:outer membrane protein assembly factor BamB